MAKLAPPRSAGRTRKVKNSGTSRFTRRPLSASNDYSSGAVTLLIAIFPSIFAGELVAILAMIFLPFNLPLSVLELHGWHPGFILARRWLHRRLVLIG